MKDGEKIIVTACDDFSEDENGEFINIIGVTKNEDYLDKKMYRVEFKVAEFLEKLYEQNK